MSSLADWSHPARWALLLIAIFPGGVALAQAPRGPKPPSSLSDPRLDELRKASAVWERRKGPGRRVVDQVCLVPDMATFLAVISTWDRGRYFPILLDDTEHALKFIRAFRP